jgi:hypothetical protein
VRDAETVDQQIGASLQPAPLSIGEREQYEPAPVKPDNVDESIFDKTGFGGGGDVLRGSANINPRAKEARRRFVRLLTHQFLHRGGEIAVCEPHRHTPKELIRPRWYTRPLHPLGRPSRLRLRPPRQCSVRR